MVHDLCAQHAASVRVPQGWELRDEFEAAEAADQVPATTSSQAFSEYRGPEQLDLIGAWVRYPPHLCSENPAGCCDRVQPKRPARTG